MNGNFELIRKILPQMAGVMNAVPGEAIFMKDGDALLILQRRTENSHLREELARFNQVLANEQAPTIENLAIAADAYIKIKLLIEKREVDFTPYSYRELVQEYKSQIAKIENLIYLTEANSMTAEQYQVEKNERILEKNRVFLEKFLAEVEKLEHQLERNAVDGSKDGDKEVDKEVVKEVGNSYVNLEEDTSADKAPKIVKRKRERKPKSAFSDIVHGFTKSLSGTKEKRTVEEKMKDVERNRSMTRCREIPVYEKSFSFTEVIPCKDVSAYVLLRKRNTIYFGKTTNVSKSAYNNKDQSLLELTEAPEEFLQFMTEDLLKEAYDWKPFTKEEKVGLRMYYNFLNWCFQKQIGVTLTVQEYVNFKSYYNRLVMKMFELEKKEKELKYYAKVLADVYVSYIGSYDMEDGVDLEEVASKILNHHSSHYLDVIDQMIANHIVDERAREDLLSLKKKMIHVQTMGKEVNVSCI